MKRAKKKAIIVFKVVSILVLMSVVLLFAFRNKILNKVIQRVDTQFEQEYQCNLAIEKAEFHGLTNVEFQHITLVPKAADTLIRIDELKTSVSFWKLLVGDIQPQGLAQLAGDTDHADGNHHDKENSQNCFGHSIHQAAFLSSRITAQALFHATIRITK